MKTFRNRFLPLTMAAGLALAGVACEEDNGLDDPGIEDDGIDDGVEDEGLDDGLDDEDDDL